MEENLEILLVEDDPRDLRLIMRELQAHLKGKIEVARDGEEALDFLLCRGAHASRSPLHPPRLIVLDLKLPKIDGFQVLREIKARPETQAIPVVALTSSREERDMIESYHLGVNSYVPKPIDFGEFRDKIRAMGLYWLEVNHPAPKKAFRI